ncbi:hypothetical protein TD95_001560 [Thielaviopsis punctulata]|uniref:FHA domain-containing protein n=1 Tax=Thielaviopsis punctulata TaxID=72032 RepID=A0A0F4ZCT4_9PEZI|nr:hypothetical protein TD95_001560 [Thielaviopsis punctulata]
MFSQSVTAEPHLGPTPSPTTSSSRTSRLRSLSYLRNYAAHHLTRDHSSVTALFSTNSHNHSSSQSTSPTTSAATSNTPANNNNNNNNNNSAIDSSSSSSSPTRFNRRISRSMSTPARAPAPVSITSAPASTAVSPAVATASSPAASGARLTQVASVPAISSPVTAPVTSLTNVAECDIEVESPVIVSSNPSPSASVAAMDTIQEPPAAHAAATEVAPQSLPEESASAATGSSSEGAQPHYSLRLTAFVDPRASRQSLSFPPVHRKLQTGDEVIKVGRYSERENGAPVPANVPSSAPIGFKSKVVSRRHCEFFCEAGKWFIKDVKSSSGTFLNHVRLSSPGQESKPFRIKDGDIVQLGIDFRGGEETMFRCVKMRVEVNRGWQNAANPFNTSAHERIRNLTKPGPTSSSSQDCTICLGRIAPCQTLFVAPCSHTWHFKCIKALIDGPSYPLFNCPNCRATTDLEAEPEEPEGWEMVEEEPPATAPTAAPQAAADKAPETNADSMMVDAPPAAAPAVQDADVASASDERAPQDDEAAVPSHGDVTMVIPTSDLHELHLSSPAPAGSAIAAIPEAADDQTMERTSSMPINNRRTPSPGSQSGQEVMTPRNNAGPWVFDGQDRNADRRQLAIGRFDM